MRGPQNFSLGARPSGHRQLAVAIVTHRDCKLEASCILSLGVKYLLDDVHTKSPLLLRHGRRTGSCLDERSKMQRPADSRNTVSVRYAGSLVAATQKITCFPARDCFVNYSIVAQPPCMQKCKRTPIT